MSEENKESAPVLIEEETELDLMPDKYKDLKVRKMNTADFWAILKMVSKGGKEAIAKLQGANGEAESTYIIIDVCMEFAETELKGFLASLVGMKVEEYEKGDFDLTLAILEKWQEQEDLASFFKRAAGLINKFYKKK